MSGSTLEAAIARNVNRDIDANVEEGNNILNSC